MHLFIEAEAISSRIGYFFADPDTRKAEDILQPYDVRPDLFEKEKDAAEDLMEEKKKAAEDKELERQKAMMLAFTARHNKARATKEREAEHGEHRAPDL